MKIALFSSAFYPGLGGVEEAVRQLAHALERAGHQVIIITERWPRDLPAREEFEGLKVFRFPFRVAVTSSNRATRWRSALMRGLTAPATARAINAVLQREQIEIINVHCVSSNAIYARQAAQQLQLPLVVTMHGELTMDANQIYQRDSGARAMMRETLQSAHALTGCSAQSVSEAQEFYGEPFGQRARVIYSGIRPADFAASDAPAKPHPRPYILGIGRHVEPKGFDLLLRAYARLDEHWQGDQRPNLPDLLMAGDGPLRGALEDLSRQLELTDRVFFLGRTQRAQTIALFQNCEFFVLPSRNEPMGIVNLEAMAAGKAVVAARVGGVPELVRDGENGLLVAPNDPGALAQAMARLIGNPSLRQKLAEAGKIRVQTFDWDALADQYLQSYRAAQSAHKPR